MLVKNNELNRTCASIIAKTLMTIIDEDTNYKYVKSSQFEYLIMSYYRLFVICSEKKYKCVLDFGCGIGVSQIVYDFFDWNFDLYLSDIKHDSEQNNEKYTFNLFNEKLGITRFECDNILKENFRFFEIPPKKFDCILTVRFPPLSKLLVTPPEFKSKLSPYCHDDFDLIYYNVSPLYSDEHEMYIFENDYNPKEKYIDRNTGILRY